MRSTIWLSAVAFALISIPGMVRGEVLQCPEKPADAQAARRQAGKYFSEAEKAFNEFRFDEALQGFLCSLRTVEHENTILNIAQTIALVEDKEAALQLLRDYAEEQPPGTTDEEIGKMIAKLETMLGHESAITEDLLNPPQEPEQEMPVQSVEQKPEKAPAQDEKKKINLTMLGWMGVGTGGILFLTAAILQGIASSAKNNAMEATDYDQFLTERDRREKFQTGATTSFVIASVLLGSGLALLLIKDDDKEESEVEMSLAAGPHGLILQGHF